MPMTQQDIRQHYEQCWKEKSDGASQETDLGFSNPVEDAVLYPCYEQLIADLGLSVNGGRVLDVGCGSGRWIRFFLERFRPELLMGVDYTRSSAELLEKWCGQQSATRLEFRTADITDGDLDLDGPFDLINVANVLFHIPEHDLFMQALRNLAGLCGSDGRIVTTEYMPRASMRTEWMLVRSRYEFEAAAASVGLRIVETRAFSFFSNDPMGVDGLDNGVRSHFHKVRAGIQQIFSSDLNDQSKSFFTNFLADVERATLAFCGERLADVDLPSQKLVVLAPINSGK